MIPEFSIDPESPVPVYRQIADRICQAAMRGHLAPGRRLPATRDLAQQLDVNRNTVVAAYDALAAEGWVRSHTGRGTFLVSRHPAPVETETSADETWFTAFSRAVEGASSGGLQSIYSLAVDPEGISFVGSYPSAELMPVEGFGRALDTAVSEAGSRLMAYGPTAGHPLLRETLAAEMRSQGAPARAEQILISNGAQQAIELVFRTFLDPGDAAIIEEPTYTGALSVLGALGARAIGVPLDADGMRPDLLELALERHKPRLIYLQPTFQNPTTAVMSESRRMKILDVAEKHRCPIVEDDWAGDLRFEGDAVPTLYELNGGRHVIYLSTFSKKLMPGLRVGWIAAPLPVFERLVELKRIEDCGTTPLLQHALHVFMRDGGLREHLERIRPVYRKRRDAMEQALRKHFPSGARWERPAGGMFLWVTPDAGVDSGELLSAARQQGVVFSEGRLFFHGDAGAEQLRLTFSAASPREIERGVATLGALISERSGRKATPQTTRADAVPFF